MAIFFNNAGFFHIAQKIITSLDTKTQLECRLVCKTWKDILEDPRLNYEELISLLTNYLEPKYMHHMVYRQLCQYSDERIKPEHERTKYFSWSFYQKRFETWTKWYDFISTCKKTGAKTSIVFYLRNQRLLRKIAADTPLDLFLEIEDVEMVTFLLKKELVTIEEVMVRFSFWHYMKKEKVSQKKHILNSFNVIRAAENGDLDTVKMLVPDPNLPFETCIGWNIHTDPMGNNPIHIAAKKGYIDIVKYFMANNENLFAKNSYGQTPLFLAVFYNQIEVVKTICEFVPSHKIVIHCRDPLHQHRNTVMHIATQLGHFEIVKFLLLKGIHPSVTDDNRNTPIHIAASKNNLKMLKLLTSFSFLISRMVNNRYYLSIKAPNKDGVTPLQIAKFYGHPEAVKFLQDFGSQKIEEKRLERKRKFVE